MTTTTAADKVFHALGNPTRRRVIERLSKGRATVSELASGSRMALPSFVQHLAVLEDCGLIRSKKAGRVRTLRLDVKRLRVAEDWLSRQRDFWERRLDQLDALLTREKGD